MAWAIVDAACRHLEQIDESTAWPPRGRADVSAVVGAEVYSESGEAFLRKCAEFFAQRCDFTFEGRHLRVAEVDFDPRW
jgi:hypothetical protein